MSIVQRRSAALFAVMAVVMGMAASSAFASVEVYDPASEQPCSAIEITGGEVSGGCEFELVPNGLFLVGAVSTGQPVSWIFACGADEFKVNAGQYGELYISDGQFQSGYGGGSANCGSWFSAKDLPWQGEIEARGDGQFAANMTMKFQFPNRLASGNVVMDMGDPEVAGSTTWHVGQIIGTKTGFSDPFLEGDFDTGYPINQILDIVEVE
jgi:hypothetical protein